MRPPKSNRVALDRCSAMTLVELLVAITIIAVLAAMMVGGGWQVYRSSSLAISANNIRQLSAGGSAFLAENRFVFWKFRDFDPAQPGANIWWFGLEPAESSGRPEGERILYPDEGPLGPYVPAGIRPDPSMRMTGTAFKPKFQFGYLGVGYNILLGGGWLGNGNRKTYWDLPRPGEIVVFATSAQVNTFQPPASAKNPMIEEFYGLDDRELSVHFRHGRSAMVGFADGSAGFLPMDPTTLDARAPKAQIGRFAPKGNTRHLLPSLP